MGGKKRNPARVFRKVPSRIVLSVKDYVRFAAHGVSRREAVVLCGRYAEASPAGSAVVRLVKMNDSALGDVYEVTQGKAGTKAGQFVRRGRV